MHQQKTEKDLKRSYFRLIEKEIRFYNSTKRELNEAKMAIIEGGGQPDNPVHTGPGDPTSVKAVKLTTSKGIYHMERMVRAIEDALKELDKLEPGRKELIKLRYWDNRLRTYDIAQKLNISVATLYRWRDDFVYKIADNLGWDVGQRKV